MEWVPKMPSTYVQYYRKISKKNIGVSIATIYSLIFHRHFFSIFSTQGISDLTKCNLIGFKLAFIINKIHNSIESREHHLLQFY